MKQRLLGLFSTLVWLLGIQIGGAQAQSPTVYAVLFFSPSCGHCHYVITEFLPPLQEEYGDQLQVLYIDVSQPEGRTFFYAAFETFDVPDDRRGYVPTLVIGSTVLIGSGDIPERLPDLVREGITTGGIDIPAIPGLREAYEASISAQSEDNSANAPAEAAAPVSTTYQNTTWQDRLNQDPLGNGLAIGVLGVLTAGLAVQLGQGTRLFTEPEKRHWAMGHLGWLLVFGLATITTVIAGTLALENGDLSLPTVLAAGVTIGMVVAVWTIGRANRQFEQSSFTFPTWLLPLIASLGLLVAGYLAYVEVGENEAVCGAVGDCNTVQQSEYATLFDLIPIGVLGVAGYVMILMVWVINRYASGWVADAAQALLLGFALFGTVFSIYLTFLEPFVIGATCAWCLTSAMLMILILCLQAPAGWAAVNRLADKLTRLPPRHSQPDW
jgi:uncharacterized membrane protein/thiol-disulfide isomerase/thioredoxin